MRVSEVVTYLQMTSPTDLVPGRPAPVSLQLAEPDEAFQKVQARVGGPHHWPTTDWTSDQWAGWLAVRGLHHWMFWSGDEAVGVLTVRAEPAAAEIVSFGLVPEATGRGLGGHALTLAVRAAWSVEPLRYPAVEQEEVRAVEQVWLHTSSLDHPSALPNYLRRGFQVIRTERRDREL
jgi:GNAT superfamily N-acetyltransferase